MRRPAWPPAASLLGCRLVKEPIPFFVCAFKRSLLCIMGIICRASFLGRKKRSPSIAGDQFVRWVLTSGRSILGSVTQFRPQLRGARRGPLLAACSTVPRRIALMYSSRFKACSSVACEQPSLVTSLWIGARSGQNSGSMRLGAPAHISVMLALLPIACPSVHTPIHLSPMGIARAAGCCDTLDVRG